MQFCEQFQIILTFFGISGVAKFMDFDFGNFLRNSIQEIDAQICGFLGIEPQAKKFEVLIGYPCLVICQKKV